MAITKERTAVKDSRADTHKSHALWYLLGWILAALIAMIKIHLTNPPIADDAFITLRYSFNLIHHGSFTYNFPTPQLTSAETSPLYGLLLAPVLYFFNPVTSFNIVMVASVASGALLLYELIRREWGVFAGYLAALIFLLNDYLYATRGMETSLFIFASLGTILLLHSVTHDLLTIDRKARLAKALGAGILLATTVFIRGEGVLLLLFPPIELVLGMGRNYRTAKREDQLRLQNPHALIEPNPRPIRTTFETPGKPLKTLLAFILGTLIVTAPMATLLQLETGSFIPGTLLAKQAQARSGFWGKGWLYYTNMVNFIKTNPWRNEIYDLAIFAGLGLIIILFSKTHWRNRPLTLTIIAFALLQLIAYGNILIVPFYHWYMGPQIVAVSALSAIALSVILAKFRRSLAAKAATIPALILFAFFIYSSTTLIGQTGIPWDQASYMEAAGWLQENTPANATVASSEIGYLGYYSQRQMVDYVGLLSKQAANWVGQGNLFYWIYYYKPDYWIVHNPPWSLEEATKLPWFQTTYSPVAYFKGIVIYKRVAPVPPLPENQQIFAQLSEVPWKTPLAATTDSPLP